MLRVFSKFERYLQSTYESLRSLLITLHFNFSFLTQFLYFIPLHFNIFYSSVVPVLESIAWPKPRNSRIKIVESG